MKQLKLLAGLMLGLLGILFGNAAQAAQPGTYFASYYTNAYGTLYFQGYVPTSYNGSAKPLVVALHGCTEWTSEFQNLTHFDALAEQQGFIVVFPQQNYYYNNYYCWNWAASYNQVRDSGEASLIAGITNWVRANWNVDANRIHIAGMSAGGAMAVNMGAAYPDLYASIGIHSGCEYKGYPCGTSGGQDPNAAGNQIYSTMGSYKRTVPVIAFTGTADTTVPPINTNQIISSWAQADDRASDNVDNNNIDDIAEQTIPGQVPGGRAYTQYIYKNSTNNQIVLEKYTVTGMGHLWSGGCGGCSYYGDPTGPDASSIMWNFFVAHPKP